MLTLNQHTVIAGTTNSGKTTLAKHIFKTSRRKCLFLNVQAESIAAPEWDHRLRSIWANGKTQWTTDPRIMTQALPHVVQNLFSLGEEIGSIEQNRSHPWLNIFADEAHLIAPNGASPGPLERLVTQGLRYGIVLCAITQRPQLLSKTVLSQSPQVALFKTTQPDRAYLDGKLHPLTDADFAWTQRRYHWLHLDPAAHDGWQQRRPLRL